MRLKIALCVKLDLAGNLALNRLLRKLSPAHDVHVILSDYVLKAEREHPMASQLVHHERDFPVDVLYPLLDDLYPEGAPGAFLTPQGLEKKFGIRMEHWERARSPEAVERMRLLQPDLILSCRYDYIFPEDTLCIPRLGAYGLHPGQLPGIQGLCGPFRAMQLGHAASGCTLFHLDKGIDTGGIVEIGWTPLTTGHSLIWNFVQTYFAGIDVLMRHFQVLENGDRLPETAQNTCERQYFAYPSPQEFKQFLDAGHTLISREDYLELLAMYLPAGRHDPAFPHIVETFSRARM